jgi:hypothetical protein
LREKNADARRASDMQLAQAILAFVNHGRRPRITRLWPALCLFACTGTAQAALQLEPVDALLTPAQAAADASNSR